jgi:hypothetical protein
MPDSQYYTHRLSLQFRDLSTTDQDAIKAVLVDTFFMIEGQHPTTIQTVDDDGFVQIRVGPIPQRSGGAA